MPIYRMIFLMWFAETYCSNDSYFIGDIDA